MGKPIDDLLMCVLSIIKKDARTVLVDNTVLAATKWWQVQAQNWVSIFTAEEILWDVEIAYWNSLAVQAIEDHGMFSPSLNLHIIRIFIVLNVEKPGHI